MTPQERLAEALRLKAAIGGGALFRPSSIERTMSCPGSIQMAAKAGAKPRRSSDYAREGTAMHHMAAELMLGRMDPEEWIDRKIVAEEGDPGVWVTEEMAEKVVDYSVDVNSRMTDTSILKVEHKMSLSVLDPKDALLAENTGTGDAVIIDAPNRMLTIEDLKSGRGIMVAGDAPQLKDYAILAALTFRDMVAPYGGWRVIRTVVFQPRADNPDEVVKVVDHDPGELMMNFLGQLIKAMHQALEPNPKLNPSEKNCRWCEGAPFCPALRASAIDLAADAFAKSPLPDFTTSSPLPRLPTKVFMGDPGQPEPMVVGHGQVTLPPATSLDVGDIATILRREKLYDIWLTSIKQRASQLLQSGVKIPGWYMKPRSGHRQWRLDHQVIANKLREFGIQTADMYTSPKLRSPAQIEKMLPPRERHHINETLWIKPELEAVLAEASDEKSTPVSRPVFPELPPMPPIK